MRQYQTQKELQEYLQSTSKSIGFVPTMGALHEGHLSLIQTAKEKSELVVCSIFVNPTQFNDPSDFEKYPKTLDDDIQKLTQIGCDVVYFPEVQDIYPDGTDSLPHYELGDLENVLEGTYRPGHFQGVCVVVDRLLQAVKPDFLFLGQKDYQQVAVIERLLELSNQNVQLIACPTVRESSGLAMSSRNLRLSTEQMEKACAIYRGFESYSEDIFRKSLLSSGFDSIDYIACCDPKTLEIKPWKSIPCVILVAAFIGGVRLIDNQIYV
jgi:pantoate--beta-alanine ligase